MQIPVVSKFCFLLNKKINIFLMTNENPTDVQVILLYSFFFLIIILDWLNENFPPNLEDILSVTTHLLTFYCTVK